MARPRTLLPPLALALLVAVAAWWFAEGGAPSAVAPPRSARVEDRAEPSRLARPDVTPVPTADERTDITAPMDPASLLATFGSGTLIVRVLDASGTPISSATVEGSCRANRDAPSPQLAVLPAEIHHRLVEEPDAEGRYLLHGCLHGLWKLTVRAPGFGEADTVVDLQGESVECEVRLAPHAVLTGSVVDEFGVAIAGARVRAWADSGSEIVEGSFRRSIVEHTDEGGGFRIECGGAATRELTATADGYLKSRKLRVEHEVAERIEGLTLVLEPESVLTGLVLGDDDQPRADAAVRAVQLEGPANASRRLPGGSRTVLSDDDGRFRIDELPAGHYVVSTPLIEGSHEELRDDFGWSALEVERLRLVLAKGEVRELTIGGSPRGAIVLHGSVTRGGAAVESGSVSYLPASSAKSDETRTTSIAVDGTYELRLAAPGAGWLVYSTKDRAPIEAWWNTGRFLNDATVFAIDVPSAAALHRDLALPSGSIRGTIEWIGDPLLAAVTATPVAGPALWSSGPVTQDLSGLVSFDFDVQTRDRYPPRDLPAKREFHLEGLAPGTWNLVATSGSIGRPAESRTTHFGVELRPNESVEGIHIQVRACRDWAVLLSGEPTTRPVTSFVLRDAEGRAVHTFERAPLVEGTYRLREVPHDAATVEARSPSAASAPVPLLPAPDPANPVRLELEPARPMRVTTLEHDGAPALASVRILDADGREHAHSIALGAALDAANRPPETHDLGALLPGTYRIVAETPDGRRAEREVEWTAGSGRVVEVRLPGR